MISIMERYASNLEDLVKERTTQLLNEKKRTEMLLLRMLPKYGIKYLFLSSLILFCEKNHESIFCSLGLWLIN